LLFYPTFFYSQNIANYTSNGSFEDYHSCTLPPIFMPDLSRAKSWSSIDSNSNGGGYYSKCNSKVPLNGLTYQYPKHGISYIIATQYYPPERRAYLKNRLKKQLQLGKNYCVKFYVNIANTSTYAMDGYGVYFGDASVDTISKCNIPLSYINPQVKNSIGNVITDTLNWVPITGTYTANGTEKYLLLGNFLADNGLTTLLINPTNLPLIFTDVLIDAVSCIEADAPAYAGPDKYVLAGDSVYIGRERDFAVDPYCVWYQLPNTISIDTTSGIWVKPTQTTTYVVQQNLECGSLKWDTVVVRVGYVGIEEQYMKNNVWDVDLFPNPTQTHLNIINKNESEILNVVITDLSGRIVLAQNLASKNKLASIKIDLPNGAYFIAINNSDNEKVIKKLLISK
jgi:hypothetical protein